MRGRQFSPSMPHAGSEAVVRTNPHGSTAAAAGSAVVATLALVAGDAAMAGVAAAAGAVVPGPSPAAWLAATVVIAVGSYTLIGIPQIALGRRQGAVGDRRSRWAIRLLERDGDRGRGRDTSRRQGMAPFAFVVASIVAGPLAIGWLAGRRHDPNAHRRTAASAAVFGATWAAAYLGAISAVL